MSRPRRGRSKGPAVSPKLVAALVIALVVAALLAIGLATGGGSDDTTAQPGAGRTPAKGDVGHRGRRKKTAPGGHSLLLAARDEVWVCLLDGKGKQLVDGVILAAGESAGPFRSGSFTLALGNGAVTITVDGEQANIPEPSSPIGFTVGSSGSVRELPEGERPTCA